MGWDVSRKFGRVGNDDRLAPPGRGPADAAAEFDQQASNGSNVRSNHQAIAANAIETGPEEMRKSIRQNRIDRRHQRDVVECLAAFVTPDGGNGVIAPVVVSGLHDTIARRYTRSYSSA